MLGFPTAYFITTGYGEAPYELNAFDAALLNAGIGNLNLLKVTSILPPNCKMVTNLKAPPGSLVPVVYGKAVSDIPGTRLSAAVGVGVIRDSYGIIMETSGVCPKVETEERVRLMISEAARQRGANLQEIRVQSVEHTVLNIGCVLAAVVFLWD